MDQQTAEQLADRIYSELYGHIDSREHRGRVQTEIYDWLINGDIQPDDIRPLAGLIAEWREYAIAEAQ